MIYLDIFYNYDVKRNNSFYNANTTFSSAESSRHLWLPKAGASSLFYINLKGLKYD